MPSLVLLFAAERIHVGRQLTDPQSAEASTAAAGLVEQVTSLVNPLFPESIVIGRRITGTLKGSLDARAREAPVFAEEMPSELLAANSTPMSIAVLPDGTLVAALAIACVQLDHSFRVVSRIGTSLYDAGLYAYAYGLSATPGGTIYMKPGMGRDAYRVTLGPQAAGSRELPGCPG